MRLRIAHSTRYRYAREVGFNPHRLMLRPRGGPELQVLSHTLAVSPPAEVTWSQDVFGNLVATANIAERADELLIDSVLDLETSAPLWPVFRIEPRAHGYPFELTPDEILDLGALRQGDEVGDEVGDWARRFIHSVPTDTLALLKDVNAGVAAAVAYRTREEEGTQTAAETLRIGSGSCRDLAALFVEAVRRLGFGARAVSGYLFDPAVPASETTHAWAQVYLPGAGWIAFDPTNGRTGEGNLIAVAVGRCNAQVLPVIGSYVGDPGDFAGIEVRVAVDGPADKGPSEPA